MFVKGNKFNQTKSTKMTGILRTKKQLKKKKNQKW